MLDRLSDAASLAFERVESVDDIALVIASMVIGGAISFAAAGSQEISAAVPGAVIGTLISAVILEQQRLRSSDDGGQRAPLTSTPPDHSPMASVTVGPRPRGGWQVIGKSGTYKTQALAIASARRRLLRPGGGELVVMGRDGQVRMQNTIDPRRSKG